MREHQIIINLRPEHYQELERLSRVAGSRSVSIFVKERILASLGIANGSASAGSGSANMAAVTADIRRLHRDLQVFVAESLSGKDFGYVSGDPSDLVEQQLSDDIPDFAVPQGQEQDEQTRDFEDEPPLPAQPKAIMPPVPIYPDVPGAPRILPVTSNVAPPAVSLPASSSSPSSAVSPSMPSDQAIPRPKLPDFPITQPIPRVSSPFGPITGANVPSMLSGTQSTQGQPAQAQAQAAQPQTPQQSASPQSVPQPFSNLRTGPARDANVPDDLEELAERAFAISPRLGAMDEIDDDKPMFSDPLDELLGDMEDDEPIVESLVDSPPPPAVAAPSAQQQSRRPAPASNQPVTSEPLKRDFAEEVMRLAKEAEQAQESQQAQNVQQAHQIQLSPSANEDEENRDEEATPAEDLAVQAAVKQQSASGANPALAFSDPPPPPEDDDNASENSSNTQAQTETSPADAGSDAASSGESDQSSTQNPPPISGGPPPRRRRT